MPPPLAFGAIAALLVASVAASGGCQRKEGQREPPVAASFILIDAGRGPLRELRYPAEKPPDQKVAMTLRVSMKMKAPGSPIPPVAMPGLRLLFDIEGRRMPDATRYDFTVADADLVAVDAAHPSGVTEMSKDLARLAGSTGTMVIDDRGRARELSMALPTDLDCELRQFMNSARLGLGGMAVPLPQQPVGLGAKWQVEEAVEQDGLRVEQRTSYELTALEGTRVQVRTQTVQSAAEQRAALACLPAGVSAQVLSLRGAGTGEMELDLRRVVPGSAQEEVETDLSFAIRQGETERVMSLTSTATVEIQAL